MPRIRDIRMIDEYSPYDSYKRFELDAVDILGSLGIAGLGALAGYGLSKTQRAGKAAVSSLIGGGIAVPIARSRTVEKRRIITPGEIAGDGCVLLLPMNENTGVIAYDFSGYQNHGRFIGEPLWVPGIYGYALDLDGEHDYIDCGIPLAVGEATFEWWMKSSHSEGNVGIVGLGAYNGLALTGVNPRLLLNNNNNRMIFDDASSYLDGEWHHWALYIAGSGINDIDNATLMIDGNNIAGWGIVKTLAPVEWTQFHIGRSSYGYLKGTIDEFRAYTRGLSPDQITAHVV